MKKLLDEEKAKLQAKIEQVQAETIHRRAKQAELVSQLASRLAGRWYRLGANILDSFYVVVAYAVAHIIGIIGQDLPFLLIIGVLPILALIVVQAFLLSTAGQTIGKRMMNIRIVKAGTGENGGFVTNIALRFLLNELLGIILFYKLVDILFIFREDRRCIHDLIAGTRVIRA